ncbi:hypothetical protein D4764_21G0008090 [Takifugu flavidus]|uniref:Uncharacterized protein n=1 Tax=Takifugu flavidus TaxID=433684 RepID=A0A5C6NH20_9TELE|nr:hypothetical protein D4764_21G0008090 [Takifugu flavidus]
MLTRKVLLFSLLILLVQADLDSNDTGIQAIATDQGSSDEAPTGSMNVLSPDQLESVKMVSPEQPGRKLETISASDNKKCDDDDGNDDDDMMMMMMVVMMMMMVVVMMVMMI